MEPLGLPRGSVRAILTGILIAGAAPVAIFSPADGQTFYAALAGIALRDYFSHRADQNRADGPTVGPSAIGDGEVG